MNLSFKKQFSPSGTVCNQMVSVSKYQLDSFMDEIFSLHETDEWNQLSFYEQMFIQKPIERKENKYFLNLTQKDFFCKFFNLHLKDRNTCLLIK